MKRIIALASLAVLCQLANSAYAIQPVVQYDFTATPGSPGYNDYFNGSTIDIGVDTQNVVSFSFYDAQLSSTPYVPSLSEDVLINTVTSDDQNGWTGTFEVIVDGVTFEATGDGAEVNGVNGSMTTIGGQDPAGAWNVPGVAPVPDASSALTLMLGSMGLVGGLARRFRSRTAA